MVVAIIAVAAIFLVLLPTAEPSTSSTPEPADTLSDQRESAAPRANSSSRDGSVQAAVRTPLDPSQSTHVTYTVHHEGAPLVGAVVRVWNLEAGDFTATSDDDGHAELDLPPGEWRAEVEFANYRAGYGRTALRTTAGGEPIEAPISMEPLLWVEGIVVDENDRPLAGAYVGMHDQTDAHGLFRTGFTEKIPLLYVRLDGYARVSIFLDPADAGFQRVVLRRAVPVTSGRVTGRVVDELGSPSPRAMISCHTEDDAGRPRRSPFAGADDAGRFEIMCGAPSGTLGVQHQLGLDPPRRQRGR